MDMYAVLQSVIASLAEIVVVLGACGLLMAGLFIGNRHSVRLVGATMVVIIAAAIMTLMQAGVTRVAYSGMFVGDDFAVFFKLLFYLATGLAVLMSGRYLDEENIARGEYYVLLLFALCGMMIMASGLDLLSIYLGLELQALSIYVLTGFMREDRRSNEAALKYVILGAVSSGVFLYGLSLLYGLTGTTQLTAIADALSESDVTDPGLVLGTVFLVMGLVFKVGAVPLHMWVPDVYEGAPTPITAFLSVASKAAAFAVILRIFLDAMGAVAEVWVIVIAVVAVLTMALGSFVALVQTNIKRMLAYSSIAHAGFVLLGLVAGARNGVASIMLYLLIYAFMNLGIFAAVVMMRNGDVKGEMIDDYTGFAKVNRGLALVMLIFLFSLAGIPPTAGFFAKFYILVALVEQGYVALAVIAVLLSAVAAYFYIRIVMLMYMKEPTRRFDLALTPSLRLTLAVTVSGTVGLGLFPGRFLDLAQAAVFSGIG
ncbi:MAG: NADH-quinone oxidoreductase subunit N [Sphingomonadales bacterium]